MVQKVAPVFSSFQRLTFGIGSRWYIDEILVDDAVTFIEKVVESIHQILQEYVQST